ncbi:hypothetical protein [Bacillus cereus group sp. BfR-BA-01331]|uniref:hypothetical protein n=1 Tax=Bacillus cereus group sp. BfR-BA-01331 TaxID=2920307 RepID=UPI001F5A96EE|nr:hypothetical protein [Bacillus cereus group sp. BfR-BA-01331]
MDKEYEKLIVRNFFQKKVQDRIIFELASSKKRMKALGRLAHDYDNILNSMYFEAIPKDIVYAEGISTQLKNYGANDSCYVMSLISEIDGKFMKLESAIEEVIWRGLPCLISCIPNKLLYFQAEQVSGPPERYILRKN